MTDTGINRITEYVRDRAGDGLRTVVTVREDGWELQYLRSDLKAEYAEEEYTKVVNTFRFKNPFLSPGTEHHPVGKRRAIVHYHENAIVLQFPLEEYDSLLVSLTPAAGRDLLTFIEECRQRL